MMSRQKSSIDTNTVRVRPKPFTQVMLEDVEDYKEEGLLPLTALDKPLKMEFDAWTNSNPSPEFPESVEMFWNGSALPVKTWIAPIAKEDHFIEVPAAWLFPGTHEVRYLLTLHTGQPDPSEVRVLTVDRDPPKLHDDNKLVFDTNVIDMKYLDDHHDVLKVKVPLHLPRAPGDVVIATWRNPLNNATEEVRTPPLTAHNYEYDIFLEFSKELILRSGDGKREVTYRVEDRAGNQSVIDAEPAELLVAVIRAPRYLPSPWLDEADKPPAEWGKLDPENTLRGATVRIPDKASFYDDDRLEVQFGAPGATGSITVPVVKGSLTVSIPKESIAAYMGSTLPVTYVAHSKDGSIEPEPSKALTLEVGTMAPARLPGAQLAAPFSDPVYKKTITSAGLPVFQRKWAYISTKCLITITVSGTGTDNKPKTLDVVKEHLVSEDQVTEGLNVSVAQAFMFGLMSDKRFTVQTQVSFNNGARWFPFTTLSPTLHD